jgi:hypothetical protein
MPEKFVRGLGVVCDGAPHADWCPAGKLEVERLG